MITALSLFEQGFRSLPSPVAFVRAGDFFQKTFFSAYQAAQGGTLPVFYANPTNRKSTMVATNDIGAEVLRKASDRAGVVVGIALYRARFDGKRG